MTASTSQKNAEKHLSLRMRDPITWWRESVKVKENVDFSMHCSNNHAGEE